MEKSKEIKDLAKALSIFSQKVGKIKKEATNPFFKSKYATLSNILDVIEIPLFESGLAISQIPTDNNTLTTILMHTDSGQYIQGAYAMNPVKNDPQGIGSAITYARRYALGAILGLNIDEDDDGNKANFGNGSLKAPEKQKVEKEIDYKAAKLKIDSATDLESLANIWKSLTPEEQRHPVVLAQKDILKHLFSKDDSKK